MAKHEPCKIWPCCGWKRLEEYPKAYVATQNEKELKLSFFMEEDAGGWAIIIPRHLAKMLAKRIEQCLESTK